MKVERLKDKDGNYCYPLSHAKSTIYGNEDEYTVFEVIEKLKQRVADLENRPSGASSYIPLYCIKGTVGGIESDNN